MSLVAAVRIAMALALGSAAGLNTTLPLLLTGLLSRWGLVSLTAPYRALGSTPILVLLAVLAVGEFLADKLPGIATVVQALQWPAALLVGAFLTASQLAAGVSFPGLVAGPILLVIGWPGLVLVLPVLGGVLAALIHGTRLAVRPLVTAATLGVGHVVLSLAEDGLAVLLVLTALLVPLLGALLWLALLGSAGLVALWGVRLRRGLLRFWP